MIICMIHTENHNMCKPRYLNKQLDKMKLTTRHDKRVGFNAFVKEV